MKILEEKVIEEIHNLIAARDELLEEVEVAHEILARIGIRGDNSPLVDRIKMMIEMEKA